MSLPASEMFLDIHKFPTRPQSQTIGLFPGKLNKCEQRTTTRQGRPDSGGQTMTRRRSHSESPSAAIYVASQKPQTSPFSSKRPRSLRIITFTTYLRHLRPAGRSPAATALAGVVIAVVLADYCGSIVVGYIRLHCSRKTIRCSVQSVCCLLS